MAERQNILILCTRNSARSQIAEALFRKYVGERFNVYSAGLQPDEVHPMVARVMAEVGIDTTGQRSKSVQEYLGKLTAHHLFIVCENVEKNCPRIFPGPGERHYWPFDDPAAVASSPVEQLAAFRQVRDQIDERIRQWLAGLNLAG